MNAPKPVCLLWVCCLFLTAGATRSQDAASVPNAPQNAVEASATTVVNQPPENWLETRVRFEELAEAGDFDAAEALEPLLLEYASLEFGEQSDRLAETHRLIASIRQRRGDYTAAEAAFLDAIDIYSERDGPLAVSLIDPFLELGQNYDSAGDYASALSAYSEARTIGRRNYGLLNTEQLEIIDIMTASAERLGQFEEAHNLQLEALTLIERSYAETSLEALEARYKFAGWLRRHRRYEEERRIYFEILRILNREYPDDPLLVVRALRERAASYRAQDNGDTLGLGGLRDAVEIVESLPGDHSLLLAQLHVDVGDWNVEFSRTGVTGDDYLIAWNYLANVPNGEQLRREWFDGMAEIEMDPISSRGLSTDPDAPSGYVVVRFTVDRSGRVRDVEITDSYPEGFKSTAFLRQYREARFRPRMVNGERVSARRARRNEFRFDAEAAGLGVN